MLYITKFSEFRCTYLFTLVCIQEFKFHISLIFKWKRNPRLEFIPDTMYRIRMVFDPDLWMKLLVMKGTLALSAVQRSISDVFSIIWRDLLSLHNA